MKTIVCELCEGTSFTKQGDMYVCNSCGAQVTVEDAKKMMREVEGDAVANTPKSTSDFDKYILLARRASDANNDGDAAKYYGLAQTENPDDWESAFYSVYHTAKQTNIAGIASAAALVANAINPTVALIEKYSKEDQLLASTKLATACVNISTMLLTASINHYNDIDSSIRSKYTDELKNRATCSRTIMVNLAMTLENAFGNDSAFDFVIGTCYKTAIIMIENSGSAFDEKVTEDDLFKVAKYDLEFATPRLQKKVDSIDAEIKTLEKPTRGSGCATLFLFVIAIPFYICSTFIKYYAVSWYLIVCAIIFGFCGLLCIPFKKSKKALERDRAKIEELEVQKKEILDIIGE